MPDAKTVPDTAGAARRMVQRAWDLELEAFALDAQAAFDATEEMRREDSRSHYELLEEYGG